MNKDSKGNRYFEAEVEREFIRATYVTDGWSGSPAVRLQIRNSSGHLMQSPEIPLDAVGQVFGGIVGLVQEAPGNP